MIIGFLISIMTAFFGFILGLLPEVAIPQGWVDAVALIMEYVNGLSWLFPVSTLLTVLFFALTFHAVLLGYDISLKLFHMLRGK